MSQCDRSSSFMSLDHGSHSVKDATESQLDFLVSVLGKEGCSLPQFAFKNDMVVGLCTSTKQAWVQQTM